jgi:hypothetical protein
MWRQPSTRAYPCCTDTCCNDTCWTWKDNCGTYKKTHNNSNNNKTHNNSNNNCTCGTYTCWTYTSGIVRILP